MKSFLFTCTLLILFSASAQEADTIQLREIIISARIATSDSLPYPSLQPPIQTMDLLDRIPGVVRAQHASFPISYRGQTGSRMRIQQNGARRSGLNPQGYLAQDLSASNLNTARIVDGIDRAIYGSGAIGGVLILEDRQATGRSSKVIHSQFRTNNNARQLGFRWNTGTQPTALEIAGNSIQTDNIHFPDRDEALNSAIREYYLSSALTTRLKRTKLQWRQKWSAGSWQFPQGFQNNIFELRKLDNAYTYQSDVQLKHSLKNGWNLTQQIWGLALKTDQLQDQYNFDFDAVNFQIERSYRRLGSGYNGFAQKNFSKYFIKSGLDLFTSRLEEQRTEIDHVRNTSSSVLAARRDDQQAGAFFKASTLGQKVQWTGVFRADLATNNNLDATRAYAAALSGGVAVKGTFLKLAHQVSLGRYFRFPRPEESGGELFGGRGTFRGNPDIRPECSYQLEWALSKKTDRTSFKISSWLAYFQDRIIEVPVPEEAGVFQYMNIDQARTFGIEWLISQVLLNHDKHNIIGNLTGLAMRGDDLTDTNFLGKGSRSNGIPPTNLNGEIKYKTWIGNIPVQFGVDVRHHLEFIAPSGFTNQVWAVRDAPAYTLFGITSNARIPINQQALSISLSVANLTDKTYFPFGTRVPGMGRDIRFGINYSF